MLNKFQKFVSPFHINENMIQREVDHPVCVYALSDLGVVEVLRHGKKLFSFSFGLML